MSSLYHINQKPRLVYFVVDKKEDFCIEDDCCVVANEDGITFFQVEVIEAYRFINVFQYKDSRSNCVFASLELLHSCVGKQQSYDANSTLYPSVFGVRNVYYQNRQMGLHYLKEGKLELEYVQDIVIDHFIGIETLVDSMWFNQKNIPPKSAIPTD